jgi:AbiV family abortive infection protein
MAKATGDPNVKSKVVSIKKYERIAVLSLENSLRLHFDSILLHNNKSYPSAFQLSVLALEEFGKSRALEDLIWNLRTHGNKRDPVFERKFIETMYNHPRKQLASIARESYNFSKKYLEFIEQRGLEEKKQKAVYVGPGINRGKTNLSGRVSYPNLIKSIDANQQISLLNDIYKEIALRLAVQKRYFDIKKMDDLFGNPLTYRLKKWPHKSKIKF